MFDRQPLIELAVSPSRGAYYAQRAIVARVRGRPLYHDVPTPFPTPSLTLGVALDEMYVSYSRISRSSSLEDYVAGRAEVGAAVDFYRARGWLDDPSSYHREPPPLGEHRMRAGRELRLDYETMTFPSGWEPHADEPGRERWLAYESNRVARARVLRHGDGGGRPWMVCVHPYACGHTRRDFFALNVRHLYQGLGLNLLLPVLPLHGPRKVSGRSGDELLTAYLTNDVFALAQSIWDIRRMIGWIRSLSADARVGMYGVSLGGVVTALAAGLVDGLSCAIPALPAVDLARAFRGAGPPDEARRRVHDALWSTEAPSVYRVVSPLSFSCRVPREGRFIVAGIGDRMARPYHAVELSEHWDGADIGWFTGSHVGYFLSRRVEHLVRDAVERSGLLAG